MHITETLSCQMKTQFISTECTDIREIRLKFDNKHIGVNVHITFVYARETELLTLQFLGVTELNLEKYEAGIFSLGELLFYDEEDGSLLHVGDELGGFSIICKNVEFVKLEPIYWR